MNADLKFLERKIKKDLTSMSVNDLVIVEKFLFRSKPSPKLKTELKNIIMKALPLKLLMYHDKYVDKKNLNVFESISDYKETSYELNLFMRYNEICSFRKPSSRINRWYSRLSRFSHW